MLNLIGEIPGEFYALVTAVVTFGSVVFQRLRHRKKLRFIEAMKKLSKTLDCMKEIIYETSADRVLIFAGHNSGGVPRATSPFYVSVMHYVYRDESVSIMAKDYKKLCVDAHYIDMLIQIFARGYYHFRTDRERDCLLKNFYTAERVTDSLLFYLHNEENNMFFMSVAKIGGYFSEEEQTRLQLKSSQIANLMKE